MKVDLKNDLSTLTTINESTFNKLLTKVIWCICDSVERAVLSKDNIVDIDTGIGRLLINISENEVKYKFKPSEKLETSISDTIINEHNELVNVLEDNLVNKMTNVVKDFF